MTDKLTDQEIEDALELCRKTEKYLDDATFIVTSKDQEYRLGRRIHLSRTLLPKALNELKELRECLGHTGAMKLIDRAEKAEKEAANHKEQKEHWMQSQRSFAKATFELEAKLEKAVGALEFYANKENYASLDISRSTRNKVYDIVLFDFDRDFEPKKDFAGRHARRALSWITSDVYVKNIENVADEVAKWSKDKLENARQAFSEGMPKPEDGGGE